MRKRYDDRSPEAKEWRKLYSRASWQRLRMARLRAEPFCRFCMDEGRVKLATVVDHINPHKGDEELFFDYENTQSLCRHHHDGIKAQIERRGYHTGTDLTGWPTSPDHPANRRR
ncbi:HNH endonuclease signature motif containing protein [Phenylobacterium terrae]|uniref:HNH endonuclease signature motif containing protein n=1 Tax=Phenylobacterium terrae TaxID=2665495 RepID=A0ABW4N8D9_9CAUL